MKLGILSDTHNHAENTQKALTLLRQEDVEVIIHCGDLTDADLALQMAGFRVIYTLGNGDIAAGEIRDVLKRVNSQNFVGFVYTGEVDGVKIAVTHGHLPGKVDELARSGIYAYVFCGHSHQHQDEMLGQTRLINPGCLGGLKREPRQFCILDLASGAAKFIKV